MAKLVFGMNQSLDGYVNHTRFAPSPALFRHFVAEAQGQTGSIYGRVMYEIMRYWDDEQPEWGADERAFAAAWRAQRKWVASRTMTSVGPNATLLTGDLEGAIRPLKDESQGEIEVAGPNLAHCLTELGLIDEYRIYLHPSSSATASPTSPALGRRTARRSRTTSLILGAGTRRARARACALRPSGTRYSSRSISPG